MKIVFYTGYHHCDWNGDNVGALGGTESAVAHIAQELAIAGHHVVVTGHNILTGLCGHVYYANVKDLKERNSGNNTDYLIGVGYIHFMEEMAWMNADQNIFWLHNTEHFPWYRGGTLPNNGDDIYADPRLNAVICVSEWQRELIANKYPESARKLRVIENGLNLNLFPREEIVIKRNSFIYSSAADRGLERVLKIWTIIRNKHSDATLTVCTPGYAVSEYDHYKNLYADRLEGVEWAGPLGKDELYRKIVASEFWLYPSDYEETYCITGLEMLYGNTIPVTTDTANLRDLIGPKRGFVVNHTLSEDQMLAEFLKVIDSAIDMEEDKKQELRDSNWDWAFEQTWFNRSKDWLNLLDKKTPETMFERIFIITLNPDDPEKVQRWEEQLTAAGLGNVPCERVQAVDGSTITPEYLENSGYKLFDWKIEGHHNSWYNRDMKPGELGCALSHFGTWRMMHYRNIKSALILEEDFMAIQPLTNLVTESVPCNWDMLYLGRNALRPDRGVVNDHIVIPDASYNLHSYALSAAGVKKLLDSRFENKLMPVDEFIQATYTRHDRDDMDRIWDDVDCYAVANDIFRQSSNPKTSTTENIHLAGRRNPDLYSFWDDQDAWCRRFLAPGVMSKEWNLICDEPLDGVFCLPFFTDEFCQMVAEEAEAVGAWTTDRHEFYPTTDMLLDKIGMNEIFNYLLQEYAMPMSIYHFGLEGPGWDAMSCENFIAKYTPKAQGHLSIHHDASDLSVLVNLSEPEVDFKGGGTWFERQKTLYRPPKGSLSVHPGNITHKHGARAVLKGTRYIMVSFMRNPKRP